MTYIISVKVFDDTKVVFCVTDLKYYPPNSIMGLIATKGSGSFFTRTKPKSWGKSKFNPKSMPF